MYMCVVEVRSFVSDSEHFFFSCIQWGKSALSAAAENGRLNIVKYLLEEAGSHVNASNEVSVSNC